MAILEQYRQKTILKLNRQAVKYHKDMKITLIIKVNDIIKEGGIKMTSNSEGLSRGHTTSAPFTQIAKQWASKDYKDLTSTEFKQIAATPDGAKALHKFLTSDNWFSRKVTQIKLEILTDTTITHKSIETLLGGLTLKELTNIKNAYDQAVREASENQANAKPNIFIKAIKDTIIEWTKTESVDFSKIVEEKIQNATTFYNTNVGEIKKDYQFSKENYNSIKDNIKLRNDLKNSRPEYLSETVSEKLLAAKIKYQILHDLYQKNITDPNDFEFKTKYPGLEDKIIEDVKKEYSGYQEQKASSKDLNADFEHYETILLSDLTLNDLKNLEQQFELSVTSRSKIQAKIKGAEKFYEDNNNEIKKDYFFLKKDHQDIRNNIKLYNKLKDYRPQPSKKDLGEDILARKIKYQILHDLYQKNITDPNEDILKRDYPGLDTNIIKNVIFEYSIYKKEVSDPTFIDKVFDELYNDQKNGAVFDADTISVDNLKSKYPGLDDSSAKIIKFGYVSYKNMRDKASETHSNLINDIKKDLSLSDPKYQNIQNNIEIHNKLRASRSSKDKIHSAENILASKIKLQILEELYKKSKTNDLDINKFNFKDEYPNLDENLADKIKNEYGNYKKFNDEIVTHLEQKKEELKKPSNQHLFKEKINPPQTKISTQIAKPTEENLHPGKAFHQVTTINNIEITAHLEVKKEEKLREGERCADMIGLATDGKHIMAVSTDGMGNYDPSVKESAKLNSLIMEALSKAVEESDSVGDLLDRFPELISAEQRAAAIRVRPSADEKNQNPKGWNKAKLEKEVVNPCTTAFCTLVKSNDGKNIAVGAVVGDSIAVIKKADGTVKLLSPTSYSASYNDNGGSLGDEIGNEFTGQLNRRVTQNENPFHLFAEELEEGDTLIIGSDGLGDNLEAKTVLDGKTPSEVSQYLNDNGKGIYNPNDFKNLTWKDAGNELLQKLHEDFIKYRVTSQNYDEMIESGTKNANKPDDFNLIVLHVPKKV